jgi:hypothetical protein
LLLIYPKIIISATEMQLHMHNPALLLLASLLHLAAAAAPPVIYVTRHGEKIWALGCLNATGKTPPRCILAP